MTSKVKNKKHFVGVRLNPELYRWLKAWSDDEDLPMSAIIRRELTRLSKKAA